MTTVVNITLLVHLQYTLIDEAGFSPSKRSLSCNDVGEVISFSQRDSMKFVDLHLFIAKVLFCTAAGFSRLESASTKHNILRQADPSSTPMVAE